MRLWPDDVDLDEERKKPTKYDPVVVLAWCSLLVVFAIGMALYNVTHKPTLGVVTPMARSP